MTPRGPRVPGTRAPPPPVRANPRLPLQTHGSAAISPGEPMVGSRPLEHPMADAALAAATAIASGLALGIVGLLLLGAGPRRREKTALGLFLLLWCAQILFANLSRFPAMDGDPAASAALLRLTLPFLVVGYLPLVYLAALFPARGGPVLRHSAGAAALLAPAALGALALAAAPGLFHEGFTDPPAATRSVWGPLFVAYFALWMGALYHAILRLHRTQARGTRTVQVRRARYLLAALLLYVAYWTGEVLTLSGWHLVSEGPGPWAQTLAFVLLAVAGVAVLVRIVHGVLLDPRREHRSLRNLIVLAAVLPALAGALSGAAKAAGLPVWPETLGVWRTLAAVLLGYAVLRFEAWALRLPALRREAGQPSRS